MRIYHEYPRTMKLGMNNTGYDGKKKLSPRVKMKCRPDLIAIHFKCLSQQAQNKSYACIPNSNTALSPRIL